MLSSRRSHWGPTSMATPLTTRAKRNALICRLWWAGVIAGALCPTACAQAGSADPIRIESNEVLVPAEVYDKAHLAQLEELSSQIGFRYAIAKDFHVYEDVVVRDLVGSNFHVLEDGQEQKIQRVTIEWEPPPVVRDNRGQHGEWIGTGGGRWIDQDYPPNVNLSIITADLPALPRYLIAYIPPRSPDGSCHQVSVTVTRRNSIVLARDEYCNTKHSASDPLNGTKFGDQMEADLASAKDGKIALSLAAVALYSDSGAPLVHIALEFPAKSLKFTTKNGLIFETVGVLGIFYKKDGTVAARFSDSGCCVGDGNSIKFPTMDFSPGFLVPPTPTRYQTRTYLTPGDYDLRVVLSDGTKFGRAELPLTVGSYDGKQLAVSEIALARRYREAPSGSRLATGLPGKYVPLVSKGVELEAAVDMRFKKGEPFYFYFQVYEPQIAGSPAADVDAHLRILDAKTGEVKKDLQPFSAAPYTSIGNPVIPIGGGIDVSNLPDGSYRLEVQATDATGKSTDWRAKNFTIEK